MNAPVTLLQKNIPRSEMNGDDGGGGDARVVVDANVLARKCRHWFVMDVLMRVARAA